MFPVKQECLQPGLASARPGAVRARPSGTGRATPSGRSSHSSRSPPLGVGGFSGRRPLAGGARPSHAARTSPPHSCSTRDACRRGPSRTQQAAKGHASSREHAAPHAHLSRASSRVSAHAHVGRAAFPAPTELPVPSPHPTPLLLRLRLRDRAAERRRPEATLKQSSRRRSPPSAPTLWRERCLRTGVARLSSCGPFSQTARFRIFRLRSNWS
ncbi:hypothetical protein R6Z07F_001695 [Ovis aries]